MNEYSFIGIIVALIGILKGKDIWDYLSKREDRKSQKDDRINEILKEQLNKSEARNLELEKKNEDLTDQLIKRGRYGKKPGNNS